MNKFRTVNQVEKMIGKMEHSKLNCFPPSLIGHVGSIEVLKHILNTQPNEKEIMKIITQQERQLTKLRLIDKKSKRMSLPRDKKIWKLEGVINGCKWYLKLDDKK